MYLNEFAPTASAFDMTTTAEFDSLLRSAADLGIPHDRGVRYCSSNVVVRHQRFHYLDWGDVDAPPILLLHGGNQSAAFAMSMAPRTYSSVPPPTRP